VLKPAVKAKSISIVRLEMGCTMKKFIFIFCCAIVLHWVATSPLFHRQKVSDAQVAELDKMLQRESKSFALMKKHYPKDYEAALSAAASVPLAQDQAAYFSEVWEAAYASAASIASKNFRLLPKAPTSALDGFARATSEMGQKLMDTKPSLCRAMRKNIGSNDSLMEAFEKSRNSPDAVGAARQAKRLLGKVMQGYMESLIYAVLSGMVTPEMRQPLTEQDFQYLEALGNRYPDISDAPNNLNKAKSTNDRAQCASIVDAAKLMLEASAMTNGRAYPLIFGEQRSTQ
jgi:hypothetical protein